MNKTCAIRWIDENGNRTPDEREAIGTVYREAYVLQDPTAMNGAIKYARTENFPICREHAKQLSEPGMEHWVFQPFVF